MHMNNVWGRLSRVSKISTDTYKLLRSGGVCAADFGTWAGTTFPPSSCGAFNKGRRYMVPDVQRRLGSTLGMRLTEYLIQELKRNKELNRSVKEFHELWSSSCFYKMRHKMEMKLIAPCRSGLESVVQNLRGLDFERVSLLLPYKQRKGCALLKDKIVTAVNSVEDLLDPYVKRFLQGFERLLSFFEDETPLKAKRTAEQWRRNRREELKKKTTDEKHSVNDGDHYETDSIEHKEKVESINALQLVKESGWERFGTTLRDMPFLRQFFTFFCNNAQSAALSELKLQDPSFTLPDFLGLVEHVIVPHILHSFLKGDRDAFRLHCGEEVFRLVSHYIRERETLKLHLDPSVLLLHNVEFRGAAQVSEGEPWLVFTFVAQQINCMRNEKSVVVQGAIDDIREVVYSMALRRHPHPNREGLQYPWQITEFAVIGNTPYW